MSTMFKPAALTDDQLAAFATDGWLHLRGALSPAEVDHVRELVAEAERSAVRTRAGTGMHHFEQTDDGPRVARSERLIEDSAEFGELITEGRIVDLVGQLFGEPAVLFKEKINYKHPGGGGFAPHQDATAYRFVDHHISVMVPIDPMTAASGCLDFAPGFERGELPAKAGRIADEVVADLDWRAIEAEPGDLLLFDSYAPHRSGTNTSHHARRALYLTYNAASLGDFRAAYYLDKQAEFAAAGATFEGERARVSINDDFLGKPVTGHEHDPVTALVALYDSPNAHELYDESVTELEHGLQAGLLAEQAGCTEAMIAAALLHDVGHLIIGDLSAIDAELTEDFVHEKAGARHLRQWFGPDVTAPVANHVAAKRYLCAVEPEYFAGLSPSSVRSLAVQGGPMSPDEVAESEARPGWAEAVQVRRFDDEAKDPDAITPPFDHYLPLLRRLVTSTSSRRDRST